MKNGGIYFPETIIAQITVMLLTLSPLVAAPTLLTPFPGSCTNDIPVSSMLELSEELFTALPLKTYWLFSSDFPPSENNLIEYKFHDCIAHKSLILIAVGAQGVLYCL